MAEPEELELSCSGGDSAPLTLLLPRWVADLMIIDSSSRARVSSWLRSSLYDASAIGLFEKEKYLPLLLAPSRTRRICKIVSWWASACFRTLYDRRNWGLGDQSEEHEAVRMHNNVYGVAVG